MLLLSGGEFWPGFVISTEEFPCEMAVDYAKVESY